jgi:hypothetical protein
LSDFSPTNGRAFSQVDPQVRIMALLVRGGFALGSQATAGGFIQSLLDQNRDGSVFDDVMGTDNA